MNARLGSRLPWLPRLPVSPLAVSIAWGLAVAVGSVGLDHLLLDYTRLLPNAAIFLSDLLLGIVAGALLYHVIVVSVAERRSVAERLDSIAEMNHHIRNALQIIKFNAQPGADERRMAEMQEAMDRIHWTLVEILPRVEPEFELQEGGMRSRFLKRSRDGEKTEHAD
jgi:hypothetical protein